MWSIRGIKRTLLISLSVSSAVVAIACNKNGDGNSAGTGGNPPMIADVPAPNTSQCFQSASTSSWWSQYQVQAYPMGSYSSGSSYFQQGFCGCPQGLMPACSSQGLICVPVHHMNMNVVTWAWGNNSFNGHRQMNPYSRWRRFGRWSNYYYNPQQPAPVQSSPTCTSSVAQMCTPNPGQPKVQGSMYCQPLRANDWSIGVWTRI